jgi:hypothetical protein
VTITIRTMFGLGDSFWSRPHVKALSRLPDVRMVTTWPQCFAGIDVKLLGGGTILRSARMNVARLRMKPTARWDLKLAYQREHIEAGAVHHDSLTASIRHLLRGAVPDPADIRMSVPAEWLKPADVMLRKWENHFGKPVALVRPPTLRDERVHTARNCDPIAFQQLLDHMRRDYTLVAVADLAPQREWLLTPPPHGIHVECYRGELTIETIIALMSRCITVGCIGFQLPAALAIGGPAFFLFGGHYAFDGPDVLLPPIYDASNIGYVEPDAPCRRCADPHHSCSKTISRHRLIAAFDAWRARTEARCGL